MCENYVSRGSFWQILKRHPCSFGFYGDERTREINFHGGSMREGRSNSRIEWKLSGKTSCSTKTRRYSKAVCSVQRDRWESRRNGRVACLLARSFVRSEVEWKQNKTEGERERDVCVRIEMTFGGMTAVRKEGAWTAKTKWFR